RTSHTEGIGDAPARPQFEIPVVIVIILVQGECTMSEPGLPLSKNLELFPDLHPALDPRSAVTEANRCLNCFDAPCMAACPTHIDVPGFIKRIGSGNVKGSARVILEANVLGMSCSRACPVDVLCEGACVMHTYNKKPIEIGRL